MGVSSSTINRPRATAQTQREVRRRQERDDRQRAKDRQFQADLHRSLSRLRIGAILILLAVVAMITVAAGR